MSCHLLGARGQGQRSTRDPHLRATALRSGAQDSEDGRGYSEALAFGSERVSPTVPLISGDFESR